MKKVLLILFAILLLTGCKKIELNEKSIAYTKDYDPITNLKNLPESSTITTELAGDELIYTIVTEDKTTILSQVVEYNETIDIDGTSDIDLSVFYDVTSKVKEYDLNEEKTILTITDENSTFDIPVNLVYPAYTIKQDITIDTYVGYDINDFVTVNDKDVVLTSQLDEDNAILSITLIKNDWVATEDIAVTLTNSNPYPIVFRGTVNQHNLPVTEFDFVIEDENTLKYYTPYVDYSPLTYIKVSDNVYEEYSDYYTEELGHVQGIARITVDGDTASEILMHSYNDEPWEITRMRDGTPFTFYFERVDELSDRFKSQSQD